MNPFGFAYASLEGVEAFSKPGRIVVTGRGNRFDPGFQSARKKGVEVWSYWMLLEAPDDLSNPQDAWQFKLADGSHPPLWPYKDKNGNPRSNWPGTHLLDIRPGSAWMKHIIPKTAELIERHMHDGLMLDGLGARPWSKLADWPSWPVDEQTLYANCCVNLAREIADEVAKHTPRLKIAHNGIWWLDKSHPAASTVPNGDKYCNGCMLENPAGNLPGDFHKAYAGRTFGLLPRRVPVVDSTDADTIAWSKVPGVTHVCSVEKAKGERYDKVTPPVIEGDGVPPDELQENDDAMRQRIAELTAENAALTAQLATSQASLKASEAQVGQLKGKITRIDAEIHAP